MTPDEFRRHGHALIDWIANYRERSCRGDLPVQSPVRPGEISSKIPVSPPAKPEPFEAILNELETVIRPGMSNWQHPRFFAYFPAIGSLASVLGDLASSGFAAIGLNWQASPALTELEERVADWFRQMTGLSADWRGTIHDTASTATFVALLLARERATRYGATRGGLQSEASPLTVYASRHAHSSVEKAALLAGFGKDNLRFLETNADQALRPDALAAAVAADRSDGATPCAVVATTGTTGTTAIDPIDEIAVIATTQKLWLHVDAALAGNAQILPECRWMWRGIERADSIVTNPHKWLGTVFDCSLFYVRDPEHLIRVMSSNPSYLRTAHDASAINYRDWGIPLGRRFRALKLWFHIREQGVSGLQARLRRDLANAQWFKEQVDAASNWRRLAPVPLQTVCVRHEPPGLAGEALDRHTLAWCARINDSGFAMLTPSQLDGQWMVRVSIGAEPTEREHVEALWREMQRVATLSG